MKKTLFPLVMTSAFMVTSCNSLDELINTDDFGKDMISFSLSDGNRETRAGFREAETRILMRIQSDDRHSSGAQAARYTRAVALAAIDGMSDQTISYSTVSTSDDPRYWDDAFGRYGELSVYAIAIANKNSQTLLPLNLMYDGTGTKSTATVTAWGSGANNTVLYSVKTDAQTTTTIGEQDLVYSNNIQQTGKDGIYRWDFTANKHLPDPTGLEAAHKPGRMLFAQNGIALQNGDTEANPIPQPDDTPGHFDQGHLKFKHALSRLTITLKEGNGYNGNLTDAADFKFTARNTDPLTNIKLLNMNTSGTLDVKTGVWTYNTPTNINKLAPQGTYSSANGTYMAQMLPGYTFSSTSDDNVMEFTIDNNTYFITQKMIQKALQEAAPTNGLDATATSYTMEQGKNYNLTITVNKKSIESITATLADWVIVDGSTALDNSHITVSTKALTGTEGTACTDFKFYRLGQELTKIYTDDSYYTAEPAKSFSGTYEGPATMTETSTSPHSNVWNSNWYYEDNKTAYHFRTLNSTAAGTIATSGSNSIFNMVSGSQDTHDYHWGAPLNVGANMKYDPANGFSANIHQGMIAPVNKDNHINITEFHMMSNINVRLVTDSIKEGGVWKLGPAAVNLKDATITITRFAKTAKVDMGTGLITESYVVTDPHTATDTDCAVIDAPSFTATDCWWVTNAINTSTDWYSYAVIPQSLRRGTSADPAEADCIGLTITTADNNQYYVIKKLADIVATSVEGDNRENHNGNKITRWYPGHTYNYTIKITKKGIDAITCTVADWVIVNANEQHINLEN